MTTIPSLSAADLAAQAQASKVTKPGANTAIGNIEKTAEEFEAVFISQMLGHMFSGIKTDGPFGGGQGEEAFRGFLLEEYAAKIAEGGGIGVSDAVKRELLALQEIN